MERVIWKCLDCMNDILPPEGVEDDSGAWIINAVALLPGGGALTGKFDILGRVGEEVIWVRGEEKPAMYPAFCYRKAGKPSTFSVPSEFNPLVTTSRHSHLWRDQEL